MNVEDLKETHDYLISDSNSEWLAILELSSEVKQNFKDYQCLTSATFDKILSWKLQKQKSKTKKIKDFSPYELVKSITTCYNEVEHPNDEMNIRIKMHVLLSLPWLGIEIASAILALHNPEYFGSIDTRSWHVLYKKEKKTFSINDYINYLNTVRSLAQKLGRKALEIDYCLWKINKI